MFKMPVQVQILLLPHHLDQQHVIKITFQAGMLMKERKEENERYLKLL